eukprot:c5450_g1_i1.p1 GENE.c5450_g1_i1~~c5450_g1_i1.p1  ORF type:complete len:242 (-),score=34.52 c5450_g1_i1:28-753(-)
MGGHTLFSPPKKPSRFRMVEAHTQHEFERLDPTRRGYLTINDIAYHPEPLTGLHSTHINFQNISTLYHMNKSKSGVFSFAEVNSFLQLCCDFPKFEISDPSSPPLTSLDALFMLDFSHQIEKRGTSSFVNWMKMLACEGQPAPTQDNIQYLLFPQVRVIYKLLDIQGTSLLSFEEFASLLLASAVEKSHPLPSDVNDCVPIAAIDSFLAAYAESYVKTIAHFGLVLTPPQKEQLKRFIPLR